VVLFNEAVIVTDWALVTVPAVAVKFAVLAPAGTVTEAGTVRAGLFEAIATTEPPVGAGFDNVAVQIVTAPEPSDPGEHCKEDMVGGPACTTLTAPPVPETDAKFPSVLAPITLLKGIGIEVALVEFNVTVKTATTPLAIAVLFVPLAKQVTVPLAPLQESDLPAAVRALPAAPVTEATSVGGYDSFHCKPAGEAEEFARVRFNETVPPGAVDPVPKLSVLWLYAEVVKMSAATRGRNAFENMYVKVQSTYVPYQDANSYH
jgi:hypothetical protein